jgi:hypothetical protein
VAAQERDRLALDVLGEREIPGIGERQIVILDQPAGVVGSLEVQPMPVDDRGAGQDQAQRLNIVDRKLVETLERGFRQGAVGRRRMGTARRSQWCVVVALPSPGRRSDRVPKKMPNVTPSTAS